MFRLVRMPSESIWKDPILTERLARYKSIFKGEKIARYLIAKKISIEGLTDEENKIDKMWELHKKARMEFNLLLKEVDEKKVELDEISDPDLSFLDLKVKLAFRILENCHFCERECNVNRKEGKKGVCQVGEKSVVSSKFLHIGEEPPLVPSGTIFFSGCVFKCVFCQNWSISQEWNRNGNIFEGKEVGSSELANYQRELVADGAININWVGGDPIPNVHNILESLQLINHNVVQLWNSNMYLTMDSMELLVDIMDFWLPDLKYRENSFAKQMSGVDNYWEVVTRNIKFAYTDGSREIIIRHLCMPNRIEADTHPILDWVNKQVPLAFVNIMAQYRPEYQVHRGRHDIINRRITSKEMELARQYADKLEIAWRQV
ncbi:MAG: radical SAM protein [Candidatus Hodarchaeales archaeon]